MTTVSRARAFPSTSPLPFSTYKDDILFLPLGETTVVPVPFEQRSKLNSISLVKNSQTLSECCWSPFCRLRTGSGSLASYRLNSSIANDIVGCCAPRWESIAAGWS